MKLTSLLSALLICFAIFITSAQSDPNATTPKDSIWNFEGNFQFLINQAAFNNDWQGGGTSNYSANVVINYDINYNKGKYAWDTKFLGDYGINKTKDQEFYRKTNDRLEINSTVGRQIGESKWFTSAFVNFRTQFDSGYTFGEDVDGNETRELRTQFMSPAFTQLGLGALWKESDDIRVNLSPVTGRIITANSRFTTTPGYVDGDFFGLDEGSTVRTEFGASVNAFVKFKLMENITVGNVLGLYSNYLEDPQNVDIDYTLNLVMNVNKYISANFTFQAIYDDNAVRGFQVREVLGVGFNYDF
ncbi:DUF3078 domain-containing protein [Psychroflexus montanilacus]|uniref:DUF3078 domain-containing protein n=1 Tax=Psychroflexus montanilacus TaxID=2873598 RepID=UPI001CCAFB52|nr:DUF3078 domain-containing protein [Psychroflexus montanilacus]MBZ9651600.1 DUF3078 domain-containing protein [Psychroflexus montanilacus]